MRQPPVTCDHAATLVLVLVLVYTGYSGLVLQNMCAPAIVPIMAATDANEFTHALQYPDGCGNSVDVH
jgi:hypothetical protein